MVDGVPASQDRDDAEAGAETALSAPPCPASRWHCRVLRSATGVKGDFHFMKSWIDKVKVRFYSLGIAAIAARMETEP